MDQLINGLVVGLHLVSVHAPSNDYLHDANPGIYARTEAGWTAGIYRNSFRRTSVYGGFTFTTEAIESLPVSLTVGMVSGYQRKLVGRACDASERPAPYEPSTGGPTYTPCGHYEGYSSRALTLMLAPSVAFPVAERFVGVVPRLSYLPRLGAHDGSVFHLSVERTF